MLEGVFHVMEWPFLVLERVFFVLERVFHVLEGFLRKKIMKKGSEMPKPNPSKTR